VEDGMTQPALRLAALALVITGLLLLSGRHLGGPLTLVRAQGPEVFITTSPPKVYSGVPTHTGDADADPTLGLTGYCVDVAHEGHTAFGPNNGFTIQNGTVIDTDFFDNGSATTTDDVYCVTAVADRIEGALPRPDMIIHWNFLEDGSPAFAELSIDVVTVELLGTDTGQGPGEAWAGTFAQVCTRGWDPLFLTGGTTPDSVDVVVTADWSSDPSNPPTFGVPYRAPGGIEWCVNVHSDVALADIDISLSLVALYNLNLVTDDVPITETEPDLVTFNLAPGDPELFHVRVGGQLDPRQVANPNVIGRIHTACILPSTAADSLDPQNIQFQSPNGANAILLQVFHAAPGQFGLDGGEICFSWTSTVPGLQNIWAVLHMDASNPQSGGVDQTVTVGSDTLAGGNQAPLVKLWNRIDRTVINTGGNPLDPATPDLTNGTINLPIVFNVNTGTYVGDVDLTEWVIGSRPDPQGSVAEPIDGVPVRLEIISPCGYFGDGPAGPKVLDAVTDSGRVDFEINIFEDGSCGPSRQIQLRITASYPPAVTDPPGGPHIETLDINLAFIAPEASPIVVWAGTTVTLNYGFGGECDEQPVHWFRESGVGSFVGGGADEFETTLVDCETVVQFESEVPGEVVIAAQLANNRFSKTVFPIFFLAFEDLTLEVGNTDPTVSQFTPLNVNVRGWFVGDNPSGRPAETKPDGRKVPQDRFVLPDDWALLKGPDDFRPGWPGSPTMPFAPVTFFMENESVVNSFTGGVKHGAAGMFVPDGGTFAHNINPVTGEPSKLGNPPGSSGPFESVLVPRHRIISKRTDAGGFVAVDVFGDYNLSFEECAKNPGTGNPHCDQGDMAGRTTYFAVVDYPDPRTRGKLPPVTSNKDTINFHWAGYKRVTWQPGPTPNIRYVVAHLKDRDGFCDAIQFNNTLGILVRFELDSKDGIIFQAADRPFVINVDGNRKFADVTTFDTQDDLGAPMNAQIVKVVQEEGECQAWIRIDNSIGDPVDVHVTFPGSPSPVPGDLRITDYFCDSNFGFMQIENVGTNEVSLAGWALRSAKSGGTGGLISEEHLGLVGHLKPGERITISGNALLNPWLNAGGQTIFPPGDYGRLVWEERTIDFQHCDGTHIHPSNVRLHTDGEGPIEIDIIVPFNDRQTIQLAAGWNLVSIMGGDIPLEEALGSSAGAVTAIYTYDEETDAWHAYLPGIPEQETEISVLENGRVYWVLAKRPFTLVVPR
jgi:hypothetical protein